MTIEAISPQPRGKRKKLSKKVKWGIVLGIFSIPFVIFGLGSIDASPDDYSAVTPPERSAPLDDENILYHMSQMTELSRSTHPWVGKLFWIEQKYGFDRVPEDSPFHPDHQWDQFYWDQVLLDHEGDLKHLRAAFAAPHFYNKVHYKSVKKRYDITRMWMREKLHTVIVLNHLHNQEWRQAIKEMRLQRDWFARCIRGVQTEIELRQVQSFVEDSFRLFDYIFQNKEVPSEVIYDCIDILKMPITPILKSQYSLVIKHEFMIMKETILSGDSSLNFTTGEMSFESVPYCVHRNRLVNRFAEISECYLGFEYLSPIDISLCYAKVMNELKEELKLESRDDSFDWDIFFPNGLGRILQIHFVPFVEIGLSVYKPQIYSQLYMIKAAARLYQQEHGELPNTIDELYSYIGEPVYDPMQSPKTPYRYSKKDAKAWSIGTDFVDDGGPIDTFINADNHFLANEYAIGLTFSSEK